MILYHGSNTDIDVIDLSIGHKYKDFGQGFYLTPDKDTAIRMANKKTDLFGGQATLIMYEFDESILISQELFIKIFNEKATVEWLYFIDQNRTRTTPHPTHTFDIVIGPIADDGVVLQLTSLHRGTNSPEQIAIELQDRFLDQQYFFGTQKALQYIHKINSITLV